MILSRFDCTLASAIDKSSHFLEDAIEDWVKFKFCICIQTFIREIVERHQTSTASQYMRENYRSCNKTESNV